MSKNKVKNQKYVSQIVVKKGKHEEEKEDEIFNFDDEIILGVNTSKKTKDETISRNNETHKKIKNKKRKAKQNKKNNQVHKNIPKKIAEEREKSKNKRMRIFKIIKIIMLIIIFIVLVVVLLLSPVFDIKNIRVKGNDKIEAEKIISLSGITIGENTFKFNSKEVKKKIKENAYIETVKIERKLPTGIQITIKERKPTILMEYGSSYIYLNNQGYILEISAEKLDLPIIQGATTKEKELVAGNRLNKEDLEKLNVVLNIIESANSNGLTDQLTKVDISDSQDYKIIFNDGQVTAHIGDCTTLGTRMLYVKAILEDNIGIKGEIFVNMDLNIENPYFRKQV